MNSTRTGICALLLVLSACGSELPPSSPPADIESLMAVSSTPGLAVATLSDCKLEHVSYHGVERAGEQTPVTAQTLFEAASLTKTLFGLIVLQLADEGVLDLDEPLANAIDPVRIEDRERFAQVTPRVVLTHRTGMPNWAGDPTAPQDSDIIEFKFDPGSEFGYSGEAFQLLQAFVEARTGRTFEQLFAERLAPLMPDTSVAMPRAGKSLPWGHDDKGDPAGGRRLRDRPDALAAFTASTTATDFSRFVAYLCDGGGLSAEYRDALFTPVSRTSAEAVQWSLGWGVQTTGERQVYWHWGDNGPFTAFVAFDGELNRGIVYLANGAGGLKLIEPLAEPVVGNLDPVIDWLDYGRL